MKYILNIGCNVGNKAAFSPAFALSKVATMFENVHESASFRSSYEAEVDGKVQTVEENVLVVLVSEPFVEVGSSIFCLANVLDQKAIAYAPEGRTDLGALEGPHRDTWCGGKFLAEFFVDVAEAKRREAAEKAQLEAAEKLLKDLGAL